MKQFVLQKVKSSFGAITRPVTDRPLFIIYYLSFIISFLSFSSFVSAQQTFTGHLTSAPRAGEGSVVLIQDAEIEALVNGKGTSNQTSATNTSKPATSAEAGTASSAFIDSLLNLPNLQQGKRARLRGYRIQVYAGGNTRQGKQEAMRMQNLVRTQFPDLAVYTQFISPRWICRVGDFRTYEEASKVLHEMRQTGRFREASIVKSTIIYSY